MKSVKVWTATLAVLFTSLCSTPPAHALTNADCVQTSSGLTLTAVASGNYCLISITAGSGTWTVPSGAMSATVLLVGGGGGGGAGSSRNGNACNSTSAGTRNGGGGGGGGGGQVKEVIQYFNYNQSISVVIGNGGTGGSAGACGQAGGAGSAGASTIVGSFTALGGGPGLGATSLGEGGGGGYSYNSSGATLIGGSIINAGDCPPTTTTGCMAGASGASSISVGSNPTNAGTATDGASGSEGTSSTIVSGIYGSGGGGGNRHTASAPSDTGRTGGAGGTNAGAGSLVGNGADATANFGGGGGGGRGNGWDSSTLPATNAGAGGAGGSGIVVIQYQPTFTFSISQPTINGNVYKGVNSTISITLPVAGSVRFYVNKKRIATCNTRVTSGSAPNNVATCIWKPSNRGAATITVSVTPTTNTYSALNSPTLTVLVGTRTNTR